MARNGRAFIGTSGWRYDHWIGPVYPEALAEDEFLPYYAQSLDSVEINSTFYGLPSRDTIAGWRDAAPADFTFAVKASRYITHMKKLKDPADSLGRLFDVIEPMAPKLGPILFQLPPRWRANPGRLADFLDALPGGKRYAFEFRDETWHNDEVRAILRDANAAFCIFELAGRKSPAMVTADFAYVRLHGPDGAYQGRYDDRTLEAWAERILDWSADGVDAHCYFDNDEAGYAFANAVRLSELVRAKP